MSVSVKVRNKDRLFRRLRAMVPEAEKELEKAISTSAEEIQAAAQRFAPRATGKLIDSIVVTYAGQSTPAYSHPGGSFVVPEAAAAVTVGNTSVRYGHLVEYGTVNAPAQPFFWVSVRMNRKRLQGRVTRALNKSIKTVAGKP